MQRIGEPGFKFIHGISQDPRSEQTYSIELNSYIEAGSLLINWGYSKLVFKKPTIEMLAAELEKQLRAIVDHCVSKSEIGYTPSDFPEAEISQEDLDMLIQNLKE